jgi:Importin-beta N-terminal domain
VQYNRSNRLYLGDISATTLVDHPVAVAVEIPEFRHFFVVHIPSIVGLLSTEFPSVPHGGQSWSCRSASRGELGPKTEQARQVLFPRCQLLSSNHVTAEIALREEEKKPGFSLSLLQITASPTYPYNTRLASALCFKNFIKRNWADEDGNYKLPVDEVATIKRELVSLMTAVPTGIQTQLGEAVSVIADSDFWARWDTLVDVSILAIFAF